MTESEYTRIKQANDQCRNSELDMEFGKEMIGERMDFHADRILIKPPSNKPHLEDDGKYHGWSQILALLGWAVFAVIFVSGLYQVGCWIWRAL